MNQSEMSRLSNPPCEDPPLGAATLYLRGAMNNWGSLDAYAFQFSCDAYYLNVTLRGRHEFKIADAAWTPATSFGGDVALVAGQGQPLETGASIGTIRFDFDGEHTLRLALAGSQPVLSVGPRTFSEPQVAEVTDPVAASVRHDSRDLASKSPFGAVPAGTSVELSFTALPGVERASLVVEKRTLEGNQDVLAYEEVARVPMVRSAAGERERWHATHRFEAPAVYGYWFEVEIAGRRFAYQNNRHAVYWTREKGANGVGVVENAPPSAAAIRRFRLTVFAPDFRVPDWAPDAVIYYIFPDRFRNGDRGNDPKPGRDRYQDKDVQFHADWNSRPHKPRSGDGSDDVYNNDFYGGDLAGITGKLDYIRDLGANTIYLTPIFTAASNHKYDTADYRNVDPAFGTNEEFTRLTREAAARGIRVILDASLNHTGSDSIYFNRYGTRGAAGAFDRGRIRPQSPYATWYRFDSTQSQPHQQYKGWVGVADLPEIDKSSPDFRRFAYGAPDSITRLWLERGSSGWRMDVAPWVPDDFWRGWRKAVKETDPQALTVAETWFDAAKFLLGDTFDSTMNYIFRGAVLDYAAGGNAVAAYRPLEYIRETYPPQARHALMNLLSSHDVARTLHIFGYQDEKTDAATIAQAKRRLRLAVFFQMTYPGAPSVYYGDEVGVTGADDPYNRGTYPWPDLGGHPDEALAKDFKRLIKLRHDHAVLRRGALEAPLHVDDHVIVLMRRLGDTWAVTATNNAETPRTVSVTLPEGLEAARLVDALTGEAARGSARRLELTVPALFGTVLVTR